MADTGEAIGLRPRGLAGAIPFDAVPGDVLANPHKRFSQYVGINHLDNGRRRPCGDEGDGEIDRFCASSYR